MPYKDKEKQLDFQNKWLQQRRLDWLKENGPCVKCGSWEDLQVDHIDARLKISHRIWSYSKGKREIELKKCQVLCLVCHKLKSKTDNYHQGKANIKNATSKYKGVSFHKQANKWEAKIRIHGKQNYLGIYKTEIEAALAYDVAAQKFIGDIAFKNNPII